MRGLNLLKVMVLAISFLRIEREDTLLVALNTDNKRHYIKIPLGSCFKNKEFLYDLMSDERINIEKGYLNIMIAPSQGIILKPQ